MPSTRRVILHGGMPKTGTSVLQGALANLEHRKVKYAKAFRGQKVAHHDLAVAMISSSHPVVAIASEVLNEAQMLPDLGVNVYSSESLNGLVNPRMVHRIADLFTFLRSDVLPEFHLNVREITSFLEAMYLQSRRFGRTSQDFVSYLTSRKRWIEEFFLGLIALQQALPEESYIHYLTPGFDTISTFEEILALDRGELVDAARSVGPTSRFGLKGESALAFLDDIAREQGLTLSRMKLIKSLESKSVLSDDHYDYTLYEPGLRKEFSDFCRETARQVGFGNYNEVFKRINSRKPFQKISLQNLSLEEMREVILCAKANA